MKREFVELIECVKVKPDDEEDKAIYLYTFLLGGQTCRFT